MRPGRGAAAAALLVAALAVVAAAPTGNGAASAASARRPLQLSALWGANGELWSPTSRLIDFSYAGVGANEYGIPRYPALFNVKAYGARGDGITDDSDAIIAAIEAASEVAKEFTTEPCGRNRRCVSMGNGFMNQGRRGVAVFMPAGTYRITKMIEIFQSNVVLRGAGASRTVLFFPKGLQAIYGNKMSWAYMGGFLVLHGKSYDSKDTAFLLADITRNVAKGQRRLYVSSTAGIQAGHWVRVFARSPLRSGRRLLAEEGGEPLRANSTALGSRNSRVPAPVPAPEKPSVNSSSGTPSEDGFLPLPQAFIEGAQQAEELGLGGAEQSSPAGASAAVAPGTLDAYLYGFNAADSGSSPFSGERIRFVSRVLAVGNGWVDLERTLPYDLRLEWQPAVYQFATPLQHSGFEDFSVKFQWDLYPAHMKVVGNNAFWLWGCANSWIRNVNIVDADTGAEAQNSDFITMAGISFDVTQKRGNVLTQDCDGHHGLWAAASSNVRISDFIFRSRFVHDLTLDVFSQECVYHRGRGADISLDMHRSAVHNNLLANVNVGAATRPFLSSGAAPRGAHAAANNTWWNIHSTWSPNTLYLPSCDFGPQLNFVGGPFGPPEQCSAPGVCRRVPSAAPWARYPQHCVRMGWLVEQLEPGRKLFPPDIFMAQLARRQERRRRGLPGLG